MRTRKSRYTLLIWVFGLLALSACSNESSDNQPTTSVTSVIQMPASLLLLPPDGVLRAYVTVDDGERIEMTISGDIATATIPGLSRTTHDVLITYEFTDSASNTLTVATAIKTVDLSSGDASIAFVETDYDTASYDNDSDCLSNAEELAAGLNPLNSECILGASLIGCCTL